MIGSIKRLVKLTGAHSQQFIRSIFYAILSVLLSFVPFYCIYKVVILLSQHSTNVNKVLIYGGISIVSIVLRYVFFGLSTVISHKAAYQILYDLRLRIANKLTRVSLGYFTSSHSGDIKKIMVDDVEKLEQFLAHNVPEVTSNVASLVLLTIYLFILDWRMALATLAVVPISMIAMRVMMIGQEEKMSKFHYAMSNMNTNIVEYIRGMHVIKVFNNSINSFGKYRNSVNDYNTHVLNWYKSCWPYMAIYFVVLGSSIMFVLPIGSYLYINGLLSLSKLILFLIICFVFTTPLIKLFDFSEGMQIIAENERCISELLSMEELSSSNNQVQINDYSVTLSNVSFGYTDQMVLKKVNMHAKQGEMTALVGPSGGGKSTIAKLIPRFWDVQKGDIQIGNTPIKQIPIEQLMDTISFVFQDVFLFHLSIKDNIRLGKPNASDEDIVEASRAARCHEFISDLKNGYDTVIGEAGINLSGGERQRVSLARAILKDSPIIILDEATAFSDPENEDMIQEALLKLVQNKTVITIAHRLSTIVDANNIYLIDDGKVFSSGNHKELIGKSQLYKKNVGRPYRCK